MSVLDTTPEGTAVCFTVLQPVKHPANMTNKTLRVKFATLLFAGNDSDISGMNNRSSNKNEMYHRIIM